MDTREETMRRAPDSSSAPDGHAAPPTLATSDDMARLAKHGFCVVKGFLDDAACDGLLSDYRSRGASENANYDIGLASAAAVESIAPRVSAIAAQVEREAGVSTSLEGLHQAYYFDATVLNFNAWHQDAESYYILQDHTSYLNFYMPVHKPVPERTNVQVVSSHRLAERLGPMAARFRGLGGTVCRGDGEGGTLIYGEAGEIARLDFSLDELGETPHLARGDLLLMRGDTFHRTQDVDTPRVALSLRLSHPERTIRRDELSSGSTFKVNLMARNWSEFGPLFDYFSASGQPSVTWRQARELIEGGPADPALDPKRARLRILVEKLRCGRLIDTLRREVGFRRTIRTFGD